MKRVGILSFFLFLLLLPFSTWAYWVWSPEAGKFVNSQGDIQDASDEMYNTAMQFYKEKNLDSSSEQLEELLKKYPTSRVASEAQYRLGVIYEEKADYQKAFNTYKNLIRSYPQTERLNEIVEREYRIGNLFLSGKKAKIMGLEILPSLPRAAEVFKHIIEQAPYSDYGDKAQFQLGLTYKKMRHYTEAVEAFQAVIDQYPKSDLAADARYQLAETSFARSSSEFRDQRALDEASTQVNSFLTHYPDTETSEKAAKLRQEIDEKNAEKNYRIGLYYEKDNYLESALIYYADVAARYSNTQWGEKAAEKLKSLKEPTAYLTTQESEVKQQIQVLEAQMKGLTKDDALETGHLSRQIERLKARQKTIEKNKGDSMNRREQDLKRREQELKEKFKKLEKKKKLLKKNPSEDLKATLQRWTASLEEEQDALAQEKKQLTEWRETLGVKPSRILSLDFLPFVGEAPSEVDRVRGVEAKKFYKLSGEKKVLLNEKELLYKHHSEVAALLQDLKTHESGLATEEMQWDEIEQLGGEKLKARYEQLKTSQAEIKKLEKELEEKSELFETRFGSQGWGGWVKKPGRVVTQSAGIMTRSLEILNPFDSNPSAWENKNLQELLELQMHLKEKMAAQQSLVETLNNAFNVELALQEQKRLLQALKPEPGSTQQNMDPKQLRKSIKRLEKDIRGRFDEIEDRHKKKKELLKELDNLLKQRVSEEGAMPVAAKAVSSPVVGVFKLGKAFLFGLPNEDVALAQTAGNLKDDTATSQRAKAIKEELEKESLLIEAKNSEIIALQKQLEILRAQAALAGGLKFRSAFVAVPYQLVKEAVEGANRLVPKKDRQEVLINLLDKETHELGLLKEQLTRLDSLIREKSNAEESKNKGQSTEPSQKSRKSLKELIELPKENTKSQEPLETNKKQKRKASKEDKKQSKTEKQIASAEALALKEQIQMEKQELENRQKMFLREKKLLETEWRAVQKETKQGADKKSWKSQTKKFRKQEKQLNGELKEIEKDLSKLIGKETQLEKEETSILEKRIQKIDKVMKKSHSKATVQDLLTERERMEQRLSQLELRRDFLSKELKRFHIIDAGAANP